jgi:hypothetical protein
MALVRLDRYEVERNRLPEVCMRCGAAATLMKDRTFSWHPPWVDWFIILGLVLFWPLLIVGIILSSSMTKRMRVTVPLCEGHKNHWLWRKWFIYGGLLGVACLGFGAMAFLISTGPQDPDLQTLAGWTCAGSALVGLIWLIAAAIVEKGGIRASEITDEQISLIRVSPAFVEALGRERDEEDEYDRPRRRDSGSEHIRESEPRQPKDLPPDAYLENKD